jgi:DNA-binding CsgD family transcriptional regulator
VKDTTRENRKRRGGHEVLDVLAASETPAVATDAAARIVFWNRAAERLLGRKATETLGRACYEILGGRDTFGNRFCYESCPVVDMARRGETIRPFEWVVQPSSGGAGLSTYVNVFKLLGSRPEEQTLVHLLEPFDPESRLARALEALGARRAEGAPHHETPAMLAPERGVEPPLTTREKQILELVARGLQNKEIAQELSISLATVRNHVHNILDKLDVHSKLEAVSLAFRRGWVGGTHRTPA